MGVGGCLQAEPWKHIRFILPVLFTGPRNTGCKQNANLFDWIRWCRGNCIWRNVQDFFFFLLLYHYQWGVFFMKSVLNKSYHRSQAFWSSFVTCGCGCVFNFLSIKSKYAVFFCFPPTVKSKQEESTQADRWRIFILLLPDSTGSDVLRLFSLPITVGGYRLEASFESRENQCLCLKIK